MPDIASQNELKLITLSKLFVILNQKSWWRLGTQRPAAQGLVHHGCGIHLRKLH